MSNQEFTVVVDHPLSDDELDRLYEAGCDESTPELQATRTLIHFDRDADTLADAILSALAAVKAAKFSVVGVQAGDVAAA